MSVSSNLQNAKVFGTGLMKLLTLKRFKGLGILVFFPIAQNKIP